MNRAKLSASEVTKEQRAIRIAESYFFTGREKELYEFDQVLSGESQVRLIHLYGTGGIGKTCLLKAMASRTAVDGREFLLLDGENALHSPARFIECLNFLLETHGLMKNRNPANISLISCLEVLRQAAQLKSPVLAVDSYDYAGSLDKWFRQFVTEPLLADVIFILAGRHPLKGEWRDSPAWRSVIRELPLKEFDCRQTESYLMKFNIDSSQAKTIWQTTKGHPLTLSLMAALPKTAIFSMDKEDIDTSAVFNTVARRWMTEVKNHKFYEYIEAACMLHEFDQAALAHLLALPIESKSFYEFTELSFVKEVGNRWTLHELFRDLAMQDLKKRNPEKFALLDQQAIQYCVKRLTSSIRSEADFAELFYHVGNEKVRTGFFQSGPEQDYHLTESNSENMEDIKRYFLKKKEVNIADKQDFYMRNVTKAAEQDRHEAHNLREIELFFDSKDYEGLDREAFRLLRNQDGLTIGLSVIIPISSATLDYLITKPVSRAYFRQLSKKELEEYNTKNSSSSWFIRLLDCMDPTDTAARSCLLYQLFPLLLSGGRILFSTPLPFYQQLLTSFGFNEIPNTIHYDYGPDQPSPTYILDVRGSKLMDYLKRMVPSLKGSSTAVPAVFNFTEREREIVELILTGRQNREIADALFVTEVNVKKHITRILKKVQASNRAQLVKKVMEENAFHFF